MQIFIEPKFSVELETATVQDFCEKATQELSLASYDKKMTGLGMDLMERAQTTQKTSRRSRPSNRYSKFSTKY